MKQTRLIKIIENKYSLLLATLIFIIVISPLVVKNLVLAFFFQNVLFLLAIVIMLKILRARRLLFRIVMSMVLAALAFDYLYSIAGKTGKYTALLSLGTYLILTAVAIIFLLRRIFSERSVSGDTIKGSISIYLLFGIWWYLLYCAISLLRPGAFITAAAAMSSADLLYFSFATMTTVGYGDIVPKSEVARTAAMLQAIAGQMYLAILVARLVGLHSTSARKPKES